MVNNPRFRTALRRLGDPRCHQGQVWTKPAEDEPQRKPATALVCFRTVRFCQLRSQ